MPRIKKQFTHLSKRSKRRRIVEYLSQNKNINDIQETNEELYNVEEENHENTQDSTQLTIPSSSTVGIVSLSSDEEEQCNVETAESAGIALNQYNVGQDLSSESVIIDQFDHSLTNIDLVNSLQQWSRECNVPLIHLNKLLKILKPLHPELPVDGRTLMRTPRSSTVIDMNPGQYVHFCFEEALTKLMKSSSHVSSVIELSLNVDGLPLFKSVNTALWPILISIVGKKDVAIVGAYYGTKKPNVNEFMKAFIEEFNNCHSNGFFLEGRKYTVILKNIICDAPAKCYILSTKGHNAYFSCTKCKVEGSHREHRMCFPEVHVSEAKKDEEFRVFDESYQVSLSPLVDLQGFNFATCIPLDYMHLICLGVTKKLLILWIKGKSKYRLPARKVLQISDRLERFARFTPAEFKRKPRSLANLHYFKATEFRQFLLYTGVSALENLVHKKVFQNFLALFLSIRIFCSDTGDYEYAHEHIKYFVESFKFLYGSYRMSHNIHGLLHLFADVKQHGKLDNFSTFKFENFLSSLKKKFRKANQPLQQLYKRSLELGCEASALKDKKEGVISSSIQCAIGTPNVSRFSKAYVKGFLLDTKSEANNTFVLSCGKIVKVIEILKDKYDTTILANVFKAEGFPGVPCPAELVGLYIISDPSHAPETFLYSDLLRKVYRYPHPTESEKFIALSMLHDE